MSGRVAALLALTLAAAASAQTVPTALPTHVESPAVAVAKDVDWGNLARYRDPNTALGPAIDRRRVVFMGDSITQFWAAQPFLKGAPHYVGRGISGQTAAQMLERFHADVVALHPAVVHIMAGTNDVAQNHGAESVAEIAGYISAMVEIAQAHRIRVVLASIPPAAAFPWRKELQPAPTIRLLNGWLRDYAARERLVYVDYWSAMATPDGAMKPEMSHDGVHPNVAGYAAMQPLAEAAIARALR